MRTLTRLFALLAVALATPMAAVGTATAAFATVPRPGPGPAAPSVPPSAVHVSTASSSDWLSAAVASVVLCVAATVWLVSLAHRHHPPRPGLHTA